MQNVENGSLLTNNTAGLELKSITRTADYSQMITKPSDFINESSCNDSHFVKAVEVNCRSMKNVIIIPFTEPY